VKVYWEKYSEEALKRGGKRGTLRAGEVYHSIVGKSLSER